MTRRTLAFAAGALALAAGCNKGSSGPAFRLSQPSSAAVFLGFSDQRKDDQGRQALHPYVAVANSGQDELVVFDPQGNTVLPAPIVIRPLSIPLPVPRPALVVSAPFAAPAVTDAGRPDLLVAVAAASTELQLVRTWHSKADAGGVAVDPNPGLAEGKAVDLGGEVLSLVATPAVDASGNVVPDRVRVVAALTGGRLAVVEYQWSGDPTLPETDAGDNAAAPVSATPVVQDVGFDAVSLAVDTSLDGRVDPTPPVRPRLRNPRFLYAATPDPIPPSAVQGVAELDMAGTPGAWPVRGLDAHAPTRLVAAFTLQERQLGLPGAYDQVTSPTAGVGDRTAFQDAAVSRVYAYRDPAFCGPTRDEPCGIVVIDPATADVLVDPWWQAAHPAQTGGPYLAPIAVPATPVALVAAPPAWNPPTDVTDESDPIPSQNPDPTAFYHRRMLIEPGGAARLTTGVLFIPTENGRCYFADLARWQVPSSTYEIIAAGALTMVTSYQQSEVDVPQIGFYIPKTIVAADVANKSPARAVWEPGVGARFYMGLTPGFTPDDAWTVTYQGYLPRFSGSRPAQVEDAGGGQLRVAVQSSPASEVVTVFDPALGVRAGDIVELWTVGMPDPGTGRNRCPDTSQTTAGKAIAPIEGKIVEVSPPDAAHPGGSLLLQPGDCVPLVELGGTRCDAREHGPWVDPTNPSYQYNGCWGVLAGTSQQLRIRAGGGGDPTDTTLEGKDFVVVGATTGYAGRATSIGPVESTGPQDTPHFQLSNDDESLACPLYDLPGRGGMYPPPSDWASVPTCDELTCRRTCERVAVARRARRQHLTAVYCAKGSTESPSSRNFCETYFPKFARPDKQDTTVEPVGTFDGTPPTGPALAFSLGVRQPATTTAKLLVVRDSRVIFATQSGMIPAARYGGGATSGPGAEPMGATYFDRTYDTTWNKQGDRYRFYVPHAANLILDTTPAQSNSGNSILH